MAKFKKGSAAAKAFMAKLRAARGKKKVKPVGKAKSKSKTLFKRKLAVYAKPNAKGKIKPYVRKVSGVSKSDKTYNKMVADYKYFIVGKNNYVYSGWEYKSDAMDALKEFPKNTAYIYTLRQLKAKGIDDPRDEFTSGEFTNKISSKVSGKKVGAINMRKLTTRAKIESLGFKIFANNKKAFHPTYGVVYGNNLSQLLNNIESTLKLYHLGKDNTRVFGKPKTKAKGKAKSKAQSRATKIRPHYKEFLKWLNSDNVIKMADGYTTQDAQFRNKLKTKEDAFAYFKKEFIGMSSNHKDTRSHNVNIKVVSGMYKIPKERIFITGTMTTKKKLTGIGKTKDMIQYNVPEIKVLIQKRSIELMQKITSTKIAAEMCRESINKTGLMQTQEVFGILILNNQLQVLGAYNHTIGTQNSAQVDVPLICAMIAKLAPKNAIIFHNHPSGATTPSQADRDLTRNLNKSFELFGCKLLDSIIITTNDYFSFMDEGMM